MKRFQFLLLDAGPIIGLFEMGIWDEFVKRCDVTICRTIVDEAKWASQEFEDICIDLESYEAKGLVHLVDVDLSSISHFCSKFDPLYEAVIHSGEKEALAFLDSSSQEWRLCAADGAVFKVLGVLGKAEQGISLEEVLEQIGLKRSLDWKYSRSFRLKYTGLGQADSIQGRGVC
jgi:hypothetical protein